MNHLVDCECEYKDLLEDILENGIKKQNRTGVDTYSVFNRQWSSGTTLQSGRFPLLSCRKINFRGALVELFWILGILQKQNPIPGLDRNNIAYLKRERVNYWDPWANENGDLGPVYGKQLCEWKTFSEYWSGNEDDDLGWAEDQPINQIQNIINKLRTNPDDRRLICSMWNPGELDQMALPPCHWGFEFYSEPTPVNTRILHCRWIQRSVDSPIGLPFDMAIYALLTVMLAKMTNHLPGTVHGLLGDTHIYENQIDGVKEILETTDNILPPKLIYSGPDYVEKLVDFQLEWFDIEDYNPVKIVKMPVNV